MPTKPGFYWAKWRIADEGTDKCLYGETVIMHGGGGDDGPKWRAEYAIVRMAGHTKAFYVGVPREKQLDGDWLMARLLESYAA